MSLAEIMKRNERIAELTERLHDVSSFIVNKNTYSVDVSLEIGKMIVEKDNHSEFTQMVWTAEEETVYPCHQHIEHEYFMVLKGSISVYIDKEQITLNEHDHLSIKPETPHAVIFARGSKVLVITIPQSTDY